MIHLIGVAHKEQASSSGVPETEAQERYADVLQRTMVAVRPRLVAEEYSTEAEEEYKRRSIGRPIATALGIEHRFCDATKAERKQIGYVGTQELHLMISMHDPNWNISNEEAEAKAWAICIGRYFVIREKFWLDKIRDVADQDVVCVVGDGHVESFTKLLTDEGVKSQLVERGIGLTAENTFRMEKGLRYLREHPDCVNEELV
jgi:hypothetical protein